MISTSVAKNVERIPFVDLKAQYDAIRPEIDAAIAGVLQRCDFIRGEAVTQFEQEFGEYTGARHCINCGNGSDALELIMQAWGIKPGDEVIVPAITWITSASSASLAGAKPVFVDTDPKLYTLDLGAVERLITSRTRAIVAVHLYGLPVDMDRLMAIARPRGIKVLEDCAHAHGALIRGRHVGTFGDAAAFSFYPGKNLGAYGDAGAIVTNDDQIATRLRRLGNHGTLVKHDHDMEGRNSRIDTLQAAILRVKLRHLEEWVKARNRHAAAYVEQLRGFEPVQLPVWPAENRHAFHVFTIQTPRRDELRAHLLEQGIETNIHYPMPLPLVPAYAWQKKTATDFPVSLRQTQRIISLPMYAELTDDMIDRVCSSIRQFLG